MPGFETLSLALIAWIALVILLAGVIQGALGLGFPTLATPLIALATDIRTAIIVVLLPCLASVLLNAFKGIPLRQVLARFWMMPLYMVLGAWLGTRIFIAYPEFPFTLLLAGAILIYLNLDRLGRTDWPIVQAHEKTFGFVFGTIAGVSEGATNVAAPALIVFYLAVGVQPTLLVQALNICFVTGKTTQFITFAAVGGVSATQWLATLPLALVAIAGSLYGIRIRDRIDAATYRRWLRGALFAIAFILCVQYLYAP